MKVSLKWLTLEIRKIRVFSYVDRKKNNWALVKMCNKFML